MDALAVVPLHSNSPSPEFNYLTLPEAHATGQVVVSEKPSATVPTLLVINRAGLPILILDGEEIVGGRQNRVVNTTLLVPAHSTFELDVTCVEQGRWHPGLDETFAPGETVYPMLQQHKAAQVAASLSASGVPHADQSAVWDQIATTHQRRGTQSSTQAMHDVYVERGEALRRAEDVLRYPAEEPLGVVAVVSGRALCADIFDRPTTLRTYWSSLVRSYALEAESSTAAAGPDPDVHASAMRVLASAAAASKRVFPSRGLGRDVRLIARDILGAALVHHQSAVHTALFACNEPCDGTSVSRPSARVRRLRQASH